MYILVNNTSCIIGLFSSKKILALAVNAVRTSEGKNSKLYYKEVKVDEFDPSLIQFHTIHSERLNVVPENVDLYNAMELL